MQPASNLSVLGDFNHADFSDHGVTSIFFRDGSKFMVRTDGPDGALHDYQISYTFGVYPLQQYMRTGSKPVIGHGGTVARTDLKSSRQALERDQSAAQQVRHNTAR